MRRFFEVRGRLITTNTDDDASIAEICVENVEFTLPLTPHRDFDLAEVEGDVRVVRGVDGIVADIASLRDMLDALKQQRASTQADVPPKKKGYLLRSAW